MNVGMKTVPQWNELGRLIMKGQRAMAFDVLGVARFAKSQTREMPIYEKKTGPTLRKRKPKQTRRRISVTAVRNGAFNDDD
jgi:hypothetical protein